MKTQTEWKSLAIRLYVPMAIGICMALAPASRAGLNGLYPVDANTLHLWHMQEAGGTVNYDSVSNQIPQTLNIDLTNTPGPNAISTFAGIFPTTNFVLLGQPGPDATLANSSFAFANGITTGKYACDYVPWQVFPPTNYTEYPANLYFTNVANYCNTNTGAWCQECLIQPQVNLATFSAETSESISGGDGPGSYLLPQRGWQFRLNYNGGKPTLEFNNVQEGGTNHDLFGILPTTGPDAIAVAPPWPWYHVAVAYTGSTPTNGDPANVFTMYWTLLDPTRTNGSADILTNIPNAFTLTNSAAVASLMLNWKANTLTTWLYPSNSLLGSINLTIGGNGRGNVTNSVAGASGFLGSMAEYRISMCYRHTNEFVFNTAAATATAPIILGAPMTNEEFVPFNRTLTIAPVEIASQPVTNQWYQIVNGVTNLLASQTNLDLVISNINYSAIGYYQLVSANAYGTSNSAVAWVDVLPTVEGLFNTGCGPQNNPLDQAAPGSVDQHWLLPGDPDPTAIIPNAYVWSDGGPITPNGVAPANGASVWISTHENGPSINKTANVFTYETTFQVDETVVSNTIISGNLGELASTNKEIVQMVLNSGTNNITMTIANPAEGLQPFALTNGLQAGSNTLFVTAWQSGAGTAGEDAFNVAILADTGMPLTNAPAITNAPVGVTNVYGSTVSFSAVALGAAPMFYQWLSNSVPITPQVWIGTALPYLSFVATNFTASQVTGTDYIANYQIVFSNYVGMVTSAVATLDVQIPPLTVSSAGVPIWDSNSNETNIVMFFSSPVDPATATIPGNYLLDNSANITSAALGGASNEVILTTSTLTPGTSYTLSVQNVKSGSFGFTMLPGSVPVGTYPTNVALWVKASQGVTADASGNVGQWNDLSVNGNNLLTGGNDPLLVTNAIDGQPMVEFNGTNGTYLFANSTPSLALTNDMSIFAVINFATLAGGTNGDIVSKVNNNNEPAPYDYYAQSGNVHLLRGNGSGNASVASATGPSIGVPHILDVVMQGTKVTHRLDGQPNGTGTLSTPIVDQGQPLSIGAREDFHNFLTGGMAELIIVAQALSPSDVVSMENYLAVEYSLSTTPINPNPTNIVFSVASNQITLSWPLDHTGWQLQAQTNSVQVGLSTNWVNVIGSTGTNQVVVPLNLTNGSVFYRLMYQP